MSGQADISFGEGQDKQRAAMYKTLRRRNLLIGFLRLAVPGVGILLAGFLIFQIVLTNLVKDYGISGLRVDKDQVVIDQPRYGGTMPDGARYEIVAEVARVQINTTDIIDLEKAEITIEQNDGYKMVATAPFAQLNLTAQNVRVDGVMHTLDTKNVTGELNDALIDWKNQVLTTSGPVEFIFEDGVTIEATSLIYDATLSKWDFIGATYTVPGDGGL